MVTSMLHQITAAERVAEARRGARHARRRPATRLARPQR
jgi:hypothetical protein